MRFIRWPFKIFVADTGRMPAPWMAWGRHLSVNRVWVILQYMFNMGWV
jgi:hypothetical protein